jgi:Ca2+-binding EF-hand superfamily protein
MAEEILTQADQQTLKRLRAEFAKLDLDRDGQLTRDEMLFFLEQSGVDEEHRVQIVQELFNTCDPDGNGFVDLNEYANEYLKTKKALERRESDLKVTIFEMEKRV